jgi:hypothetical protein
MVKSKALAIIQNGGLQDVASILQSIVCITPLLFGTSASASASARTVPVSHSLGKSLQSLSDDEKIRLAESSSPLMIMFHSAASYLLISAPASTTPSSCTHFLDDALLISLMQSCCRCCCSVVSSALEQAIISNVAVRTWNHSAAVHSCITLTLYNDLDARIISDCASVIGVL